MSPTAGSGIIRVSSVFFGVFIGEEADGIRDKGSGDITLAGVLTLLEDFLNTSLRSACFTDEIFVL